MDDDDQQPRVSYDDPRVQQAIRQVRRVRIAHAVLVVVAFALLALGTWAKLR